MKHSNPASVRARAGFSLRVSLGIFALLLCSMPAFAAEPPFRHALIIGVAVYKDPAVPPLFGVPSDMDSAREMARAMNIPDSQITELFNDSASRAGITAAIQNLARRARDGGRLFIYFSGHGTRDFSQSIGGCVEALLTWDGRRISNREFGELVRPLGLKAEQLLILIDACHSGGVIGATRSVRPEEPDLRAKFYLPRGAVAAGCNRIANQATRSLLGETTVAESVLPGNVTYIASARSDEVSWDEPGKGGLGTQAVKHCMLGGAKDIDGSGAVTWAEVETCARTFVRKRVERFPGLLPHHVTVRGTRNLIPVVAEPQSTSAPSPAAVAAEEAKRERERVERERAEAAEAQRLEEERLARERAEAQRAAELAAEAEATKEAQAAAAAAQAQREALSAVTLDAIATQQMAALAEAAQSEQSMLAAPVTAVATLNDIFAQRDRRIDVELRPSAPQVKIGSADFELTVRSSVGGYLYLLILGSDQTSFYLMFPNGLDDANAVKAGIPLKLPRPQWSIRPAGPPGQDHLLAIVTREPLAMQQLGWTKTSAESPFAVTAANPEGRRSLVDFMVASAQRGDAFGAAMTTIEEIE